MDEDDLIPSMPLPPDRIVTEHRRFRARRPRPWRVGGYRPRPAGRPHAPAHGEVQRGLHFRTPDEIGAAPDRQRHRRGGASKGWPVNLYECQADGTVTIHPLIKVSAMQKPVAKALRFASPSEAEVEVAARISLTVRTRDLCLGWLGTMQQRMAGASEAQARDDLRPSVAAFATAWRRGWRASTLRARLPWSARP